MKFDVITIHTEPLESYLNTSILRRAREKKLIQVVLHGLHDWASGKYKQVDDKPYGGGAGMVLMAEPILKAVRDIKSKSRIKDKRSKIILFSAKGKPFTQKLAREWAKKYDRLIMISGRFEGIDERARAILKAEEVSIGPYVLTDGDVPAMVVVSAVARLVPGVIKAESLKEESHGIEGRGEYPHYTRPEVLNVKGKKYRVPKILLSGNHKKIEEWRKSKSR